MGRKELLKERDNNISKETKIPLVLAIAGFYRILAKLSVNTWRFYL